MGPEPNCSEIGCLIVLADLLGVDLGVDSAAFVSTRLAKGANLTFGDAILVFLLLVTIPALNA